jgi:acetyl esterase/lipase
MNRALLSASLLLATLPFAGVLQGQTAAAHPAATQTAPPAGFTQTIVLWPGGAPLAQGTTEGDIPKLFTYPTAAAGPHSAVIVMPGGGYTHEVMEQEGAYEARWLAAHGVAAFVLEYRLSPAYVYPAPMLDASRAIRYVRSHAAELGVKPDAIGVWGFSAGGHLSAYMATNHKAGDPAAADPIDRVSDRPDFAILSYARLSMDNTIPRTGNMDGLLGKSPTQAQIDAISPVMHVSKDTSPSFIYSTTPDAAVNSRNATAFYDVLQQTGVPVELHVFEVGPHGTGMGQHLKGLSELAIWPTLLEHWMQMHGWMPAE